MNAVLYKVYMKKAGDTTDDTFNNTNVMNEYELRKFFREQVEQGAIHPDNMADHDIIVDDLEKIWEIDLDAIFGAIADNLAYADQDERIGQYYIEQFDIRLGNEDLYD